MAKQIKKAKITPIVGWILISREWEVTAGRGRKCGPWYVCWEETFTTKKRAISFAKENGWCPPYRAVRGQIAAR